MKFVSAKNRVDSRSHYLKPRHHPAQHARHTRRVDTWIDIDIEEYKISTLSFLASTMILWISVGKCERRLNPEACVSWLSPCPQCHDLATRRPHAPGRGATQIRTTLARHTPDTVSPLQLWCVLVAHCPQIQSPRLRRERLGNGDSSKTAQFVIKRLIKS